MLTSSPVNRWLVRLSLVGGLAPTAVLIVLIHLGTEAAAFLVEAGPYPLFGTEWHPSAGRFGVLPLVLATLTLAALATLLSVPIGTLAAVRLAYYAARRERTFTESALAVLAGLPSIIVGLVGLAWLPDALRFTVIGGTLTLMIMILPTYALLAVATLRQLPRDLWTAGRALGMSEEDVILRLALPAARRDLLGAASLAFGRALGEATAVSLVIGNVSKGLWPGLLDPTNTLTTVILKDHGAATGLHQGALYAAAVLLALLILATSLMGIALRRRGTPHRNRKTEE